MKKKGQFYLVAILLIVSLVIGIVTIKNTLVVNKQGIISSADKEIAYEKSQLLDNIAKNNLDSTQTNNRFDNFSKEYIDFLGDEKNTFFVYGNRTSIKFLGNRVSNETIKYNSGGSDTTLSDTGFFEKSISPSSSTFTIYFGDEVYPFTLNSGQNIYYLIKYNYNNEVYIVHG